MRVLITGGHFSPAYSIITELKKRGHEITVAGRRYPFEDDKSESLEYQICQRENLPFYEIKTGRFQRKFTAYTISSLLKTPPGILNSVNLLRKARPDVVMTFGGYIAFPIGIAAKILGIPIVLHEQTQGAGLSSKFLGSLAKKICISFASSASLFAKDKTVFTGNPIRNEVFRIEKKMDIPAGKVIYITGGSTGSHFINERILEIADTLLDEYVLIHQTGESLKFNDFEKLSEMKDSLPSEKKKRYILKKFVYPEEVGFVFSKANLVLARAGANTIFELIATRKMSLLIPLPHGQNNEQLTNAKLVKKLGIGEYLEQNEASGESIIAKINQMFESMKDYVENLKSAQDFVVVDAAARIVDEVERVYGKKSS